MVRKPTLEVMRTSLRSAEVKRYEQNSSRPPLEESSEVLVQ